jgi:hypothetical protein
MRLWWALVASVGCVQGTQTQTFELQPRLPTPLDVLVVLDDTPAMASHLPRPGVDQLGILPLIYNGAPELRIAVTTSTTGTLRTSPAVPTGIIEHGIDLTAGSLHTNYTGTLATSIASLTSVGAASTAPNQILASTTQALATPGFVRDGDGVGIFVVTAGDDASPGAPLDYATGVQARGNPTLVSLVHADSIDRLGAFADAFPYSSVMDTSAYNMEAITIFSWLFQPYALDACLPIAAVETGGDYDCDFATTYDHVAHPLPACNGDPWQASAPCWKLLSEPSCSSGLLLQLGGPYTMYHPAVIGRCAT